MAIRLARYEDLPSIQRLYRELRPHDPEFSADDAEKCWGKILEESTAKVVVAEEGHVLVATCMLALVPNFASGGRPIGFIEHVVTLAAFRGQGFAGAVLQYALNLAWSEDCCKVVLLSGAQRVEAHGLYESLGFRSDIERGFVVKPEWSNNSAS